MTQILSADCVSKSFGKRRVLSSASLRAVRGEFRVIFGRNGEGKSTLMKIAAGLLAPDAGVVKLGDHAFQSAKLPALARLGVFYLPDHHLFSHAFTVRHQLEMIRQRFSGADCVESAAQMGIADHLDKRPAALSGGELRRAEFAAILVRRPICLLADEPYRGVAPKDAEALSITLTSLARSGTAVVVTGHEVPTLLDVADHVTWCTSGTTYELGTPSMAIKHERFQKEYLGAPQ